MSRNRRVGMAMAAVVVAALLLLRACGQESPPAAPTPPRPPAVAPPAVDVARSPPSPSPAKGEAQGPVSCPPDPAKVGSIVGVALRLDGAPAAGARVRAAPGGDEAKRVVATAGPDGAFRFDGLAPGRWTVACGGGGYGTRLDEKAEAAVADVVAGGEVRVEVRGQELAVVAGTVTGPDGEPVAKAKVRVLCDAFLSPDGGMWRLESESGPDGTFEVKNVSPGEGAGFGVAADGYAPGHRWLHDIAPGSRTVADVTLARGVGLEILLVAADDGSPVREAFVWIHDAEGGQLYDGGNGDAFSPDEKGRVRALSLNPNPVNVQVDARGFARVGDTRVDPTTQAGPFTFRLVRASAISGRLLRADGTPLAGQWVRAAPEGEDDPVEIIHAGHDAHTGDDGAFRIEGLPAGRYVVALYDDSLRPLASTTVEAGATDVILRVDSIAGPRGIRVRFSDPDGKPVPRARVRSGQVVDGNLLSSGGGGYPQEGVTVTLKEGTTAFVEAWDPCDEAGHRFPLGHVFLVVPPDAPADWVVKLPRERTVEGTVVGPGGEPVEGARIEVVTVPGEGLSASMSQELGGTNSVAKGAFRMGGLGAGRVRLVASAEGLVGTPVEAATGSTGVVLTLSAEAKCELRVLDYGGNPLEGAIVSVFIPEEEDGGNALRSPRSATTDAQGKVRLRGLEPNRSYHLLISVPSSRRDLLQLRREDWTPEVGEIRLEKACTLEGFVRVASSPPPPGWQGSVEARRDGEAVGWADVGKDGRFSIEFLPPGRYEVVVSSRGRNPAQRGSAQAEAGGPPVAIEVREE